MPLHRSAPGPFSVDAPGPLHQQRGGPDLLCERAVSASTGVVQIRTVAAIGLPATPPIHADNLQVHAISIYSNEDKVVRVVSSRQTRLGEMFQRNSGCLILSQVLRDIGLPLVRVDRSATAPRRHKVHTMPAGAVRISLHPVFEQMIMTRKYHSDVMGLEQRHVSRPHRSRRWFEVWPTMRAGRKHRVMKGCDDINVTIPIQALELFPGPFKLCGVIRILESSARTKVLP